MSYLKLLSKAFALEVLNLLYIHESGKEKNNRINFSEIVSKLGIHKSNLSKLLLELEEENLLVSEEVRTDKRIPKKYYTLTEKGLKIMLLCNEIEKIMNE
ncbi:MAG: hypothetical protein PWP73_1004, partial [Methanococcus sp.]|nr:hypothetical protein [Methanococcus sp.]